jgi:serpin B
LGGGLFLINLPSFRITAALDLKGALGGRGVHDLFDATACDLTGLDPAANLYVGGAFHKTFVAVDEKGVEAAAATAIVTDMDAGVDASPPVPVEIYVDEPFYFFVRDRSTGAPLFVGFIADPSATS